MSRRTYQLLALALTLSGTSACDDAVEEFGAGDVALRPGGYGGGGILINTSASGDWAVAHLDSNFGTELDGVILESVIVDGKEKIEQVKLDAVYVKDGEIFGTYKYWEFRGAELVGSQWNLKIPGSLSAPSRVMTIESYQVDAEGHHRYVFKYPNNPSYGLHFFNFFAYYTGAKMTDDEQKQLDLAKEQLEQQKDDEKPGQTLAVCAPDPENGGSIEALAYADVYVDMTTGVAKDRPNTINIACLSGGVGKAGLWNFLPYTVGIEAFQAAVRMVRADYCGDGGSYTKPGNSLYLEDKFGLHDFGNAAGNQTEALMTPDGARCLGKPRDTNFDFTDVLCDGNLLKECDASMGLSTFQDVLMHSKLP